MKPGERSHRRVGVVDEQSERLALGGRRSLRGQRDRAENTFGDGQVVGHRPQKRAKRMLVPSMKKCVEKLCGVRTRTFVFGEAGNVNAMKVFVRVSNLQKTKCSLQRL